MPLIQKTLELCSLYSCLTKSSRPKYSKFCSKKKSFGSYYYMVAYCTRVRYVAMSLCCHISMSISRQVVKISQLQVAYEVAMSPRRKKVEKTEFSFGLPALNLSFHVVAEYDLSDFNVLYLKVLVKCPTIDLWTTILIQYILRTYSCFYKKKQ
jgi:hypothetical protein